MLFEYPWYPVGNSPRQHSGYTRAEDDLDLYIHGIVDIRRAIDLLQEEPSVDPTRIAYVGHSIGAQLGAILSAVDDRVKAVVLIGGVPSLESMLLDDRVHYPKGYRDAFGVENIKKYIEINRRLDAIVYVPHAAPTPILFQFGKYEQFCAADSMQKYYDAASMPKEANWYATDHEVNDFQALLDRAQWLAEQIGIDPIQSILIKRLSK